MRPPRAASSLDSLDGYSSFIIVEKMSKNTTDKKDEEDNVLEDLFESPYAKKERRISNISKLLRVGRRSTSFDEEDIDQQHLSPMTSKKRFLS